MELLKHLILTLLVFLGAWLVVFFIGLIISLFPVIGVAGGFIQSWSALIALLIAVYYYITYKTPNL